MFTRTGLTRPLSFTSVALAAGLLVATTARAQQPPPRMAAIPPPSMTADQQAAAATVTRNGAVPGYLQPMLRNPWLAPPTQLMGEGLNRRATMPAKLTQLTILIVSKRYAYNGSWVEHSGMADRAGLSPAIVRAIADGQRPSEMDEAEALVYDMCDELERTMTLSDATYARALARFGEAGIVDTVATYGFYGYLGLFNNVARTATPTFRPPARP